MPFLEVDSILLKNLRKNLLSHGLDFFDLFWSRVVGWLRQRHVDVAAPVVEHDVLNTKLFGVDLMFRANSRIPFVLQLEHRDVNASGPQGSFVLLHLYGFHNVDRCQSTTDNNRASGNLITRTRIGLLILMIEPMDKGILVDQAPAQIPVDPFRRQRSILPGAIGQYDSAKSPFLDQDRKSTR